MFLKIIAQKAGIPEHKVIAISKSAAYRYKDYRVLKKDKLSYRNVAQPAKQVKALQRLYISELFSKLQIHEAATAYKSGASIQKNAQQHLNNRFLLKLDFENFFPSITYKTIYRYFANLKVSGLTEIDIIVICNLVCRNGGLVIGSPSSPIISNAIMFEFDKILAEKMQHLSITYTRYADDMTFSTNTPNILGNCAAEVNSVVSELNLELKLNSNKTVYTSKKRLRKVTGVTLTSDNKLSVGRQRKRKIKSLFLKLIHDQLTVEQAHSLQGEIAYIISIEPYYLENLNRKYGAEFQRGMQLLKNIYESN